MRKGAKCGGQGREAEEGQKRKIYTCIQAGGRWQVARGEGGKRGIGMGREERGGGRILPQQIN
jgi:hypothetical protein